MSKSLLLAAGALVLWTASSVEAARCCRSCKPACNTCCNSCAPATAQTDATSGDAQRSASYDPAMNAGTTVRARSNDSFNNHFKASNKALLGSRTGF